MAGAAPVDGIAGLAHSPPSKRRSPSPSFTKRPAKKVKTEANGNDLETDNDPEADLDLESFRKEAIYRQMLEYKREQSRAAEQAANLTSQLASLQSQHGALASSWTALIASLQALYPQAAQPVSFPESEAFPSLPEYATALDEASKATMSMISSIINSHNQGPSLSDLSAKCAQLTKDALASRKAVELTSRKLQSAQTELQNKHEALVKAEKQLDRAKSRTVSQLNLKGKAPDFPPANAPQGNSIPQTPVASPPKDTTLQSTSRNEAKAEHAMLVDSTELDELRRTAERRLNEIKSMSSDRIVLLQEAEDLRQRLSYLPIEVITESSAYKKLKFEHDALSEELDLALQDLEAMKKEANAIREAQTNWQETLFKEATAQTEEMSKKIGAQQADLARIRMMRDELKAELADLRARDQEKLGAANQIRAVANAQEDRLTAMTSELQRLRMKIAGLQGSTKAVEIEASTEYDLQNEQLRLKLEQTEKEMAALRTQLQDYTTNVSQDAVASETRLRQELASAKQELERFEALLGPHGDLATQELAKKLQDKEQLVSQLEASLRAQELSSGMLIGEVERLSSAWQTLDKQNRDKVLNLIQHEEKVNKLIIEKGKADNRYFAAMRAKDSLALENQMHAKAAEKQLKVIETLTGARNSLAEQVTALEKEISSYIEGCQNLKRKLASTEGEKSGLALANSRLQQRVSDLESTIKDQIASTEREVYSKKRLEEQVGSLERRLQQITSREAEAVQLGKGKPANGTANSNRSKDELEKFNEDLTRMLKCTSCQIRFKSHVITRCYHLLCHECIEQRLALRQRKCPTCQMAFGAADVQQVYF